MFQSHKVDPFVAGITIASVCMHIIKHQFLKPETIGVVPHGGYRKNDIQSVIAIKWIKWISETENLDIQHARNGQEVIIIIVIIIIIIVIVIIIIVSEEDR